MLKFFMVFKGRSATCHSRDNESFTCNFIQKSTVQLYGYIAILSGCENNVSFNTNCLVDSFLPNSMLLILEE